MDRNNQIYQTYVAILKKELVLAMGCTEPIAIAYAAALAKKHLEGEVKQVDIYASGNIIKNVKSVTVPHTNGRKGIPCAAAIGIVAGNSDIGLEVLSHIKEEEIACLDGFMNTVSIQVHHIQTSCALELSVKVSNEQHYANVKIQNEHANVVLIEKDGVYLHKKDSTESKNEQIDYQLLSMKDIYDFALTVKLEDVEDVLERQITYNSAIALEGLEHKYGANIANVLLQTYGDSVQVRAKAMAAAGSDARMSGCELPVVINSGSGNQGMCTSLPVIEYAKELKSTKEDLYRALIISNLSTLYQKQHIGRLSAYCGAVSAGAGAGAGIAYLLGGDFDHICHAVVNALAITSGILCDGAKASCAAKIASAVDAGILGCMMYRNGKQFYNGEGIVCHTIDATVESVGQIARDGMKTTDEEIIKMMIHN